MSDDYLPKFEDVNLKFINAEYCDYGRYIAGDNGIIYACPKGFWIPLRPHISNQYERVTLYKNTIGKTYTVHTLILIHFVGSCPPGMECRHGVKGKLDNSLENISWGTKYENNTLDKQRDGTARSPRSRFSDFEVLKIRQLHSEGMSYRELGVLFDCHFTTIADIITRKYYKDI